MANSPKFTSFHHVANAPAGHHLPHAMTLPAMNSKTHKHFQSSSSRSHDHVSTPYPVLEHSSTTSSTGSDSSNGSTDYMQSHSHHHHVHRPSIPNPVHAVQDHVSEFRYGHAARSAKREARKSSSTGTSHPWSLDASSARRHDSIDERYEEVVEDWKERDEQAWAEELRKRENARRSYGSVSTDQAAEEQK